MSGALLTGGLQDPTGLGGLGSAAPRQAAGIKGVVSVCNQTVDTAVGREHMREQEFTTIDSAVIA